MSHSRQHALRLRHLWTAYLLAMLFHVDLGLMPLFHGVSPQIESEVPVAQLPWLFWGMLVYFLIPLSCLLLLAYADSGRRVESRPFWRAWRPVHFVISVLYTITNIPHLVADVLVPDSRGDQVFLMVVLLVIGLLINREAWLWWRRARLSAGRA